MQSLGTLVGFNRVEGALLGEFMMKKLGKFAVAAVMGASALALMATSASAAIACNGEGECWHVHARYAYHPEYGVVIHPDGWRWGKGEHYAWHEHRGRGYWHSGVWVTF
jgi:hypothetical protein